VTGHAYLAAGKAASTGLSSVRLQLGTAGIHSTVRELIESHPALDDGRAVSGPSYERITTRVEIVALQNSNAILTSLLTPIERLLVDSTAER
jgi:hypothetical protein